jgi:hypothetical protein
LEFRRRERGCADGQAFGRLIESEMQRWGKLVRALNLKPE